MQNVVRICRPYDSDVSEGKMTLPHVAAVMLLTDARCGMLVRA